MIYLEIASQTLQSILGTANDEVSSSDASDDPEFREYEERSQIVEKYEKVQRNVVFEI